MEECLFRAIPLALGALVGARFGHRRAGIAVAFVATIYGVGSANLLWLPIASHIKAAAEAQNVSAATQEQSASSEEIASSSHSLATLAEELQSAVVKFRV